MGLNTNTRDVFSEHTNLQPMQRILSSNNTVEAQYKQKKR